MVMAEQLVEILIPVWLSMHENIKIQLKCSYVLMIVLTRETAWLVSTAENFN